MVNAIRVTLSLMVATGLWVAAPPAAQAQTFTDALLPRIRAAASVVPGDLPRSIGYLAFADFNTPLSGAVEGAGNEVVKGVYTVFQVRYARRWIMVDAGSTGKSKPTRQ